MYLLEPKYSCAPLIPPFIQTCTCSTPFLRSYLTIIFLLTLDSSIFMYLATRTIIFLRTLDSSISMYQLDNNILAHRWHLSFLRNTKYVRTQYLSVHQHLNAHKRSINVPPNSHFARRTMFASEQSFLKLNLIWFNEDGVCTFDGKIGMFLFVEYIPAQWESRNRPCSAIVTTPFSVRKNKYREFMVTKVIPAI